MAYSGLGFVEKIYDSGKRQTCKPLEFRSFGDLDMETLGSVIADLERQSLLSR